MMLVPSALMEAPLFSMENSPEGVHVMASDEVESSLVPTTLTVKPTTNNRKP